MTERERSYTITHTRDCRVIRGWMPLTDMVTLMRSWADESQEDGDEWVVDGLLSQRLGVNMVCGPRSATTAWRAALGLSPPTP